MSIASRTKERVRVSNKSPVRKRTTRFQCAQKHARRVIYNLNKFPLQKGTAIAAIVINSDRWDLLDLWVELY